MMSFRSTATQQGFSLIELMVTISIVVIVTGIALTRYTSFNNTLLLTNQAYEVALDLRQSQVLGVSVTASGVGNDENRNPIGLAFSTDEAIVAGEPSALRYMLFSDSLPDDGVYESDNDAVVNTYALDPRFAIADLQADDGSGMQTCANLSVTFKRPDFDARITCDSANGFSVAEIIVGVIADESVTNTIVIRDNGQISVQQ